MARIRKWQEKLMLACATLFFSLVQAWPLGTYKTASHNYPVYSRLVTAMNQKPTFGVELMARRPYVRLTRVARTPVSLPLTTGAYVAMAGVLGTAATPAGNGASAGAAAQISPDCAGSCCSSDGGTTTTGGDNCWTVYCYSQFQGTEHMCYTCGHGTCNAYCTYC